MKLRLLFETTFARQFFPRVDYEAVDILQAFGIEPPEDKKEVKKQLHELHSQIGDEPLLTTLFELAGNFAFMAQDIFDLCEETGTGIKGQILLASDNGPLSSSSLDSGWAFKGSFLYETEAQEQAQAIMSRLNGIAESLHPDNFLKTLYEKKETSLGRSLRQSSLRGVLRGSCERTIEEDAFSEADRIGLLAARDAISEARANLSSVPLPPGNRVSWQN